MKSTEKELRKACVELNDLFGGAKPPYTKSMDEVAMVKWLKAANKIIKEDDDISDATQRVLDDLSTEGKVPAKKEEPIKKGKKAPVEEDEDEDEDEDDEEPEPAPVKKGKKVAEPEPEEDDDEDEDEDEEPAPVKKSKKVEEPVKKGKKVVEEDDDDDDEEPAPKKKGKEVPAKKEKKEKVETTPKWQILIKTVVENQKSSIEQIKKILQKEGHSISAHSIEVYFKEVHFALSLL